jgi:hypothetical protein
MMCGIYFRGRKRVRTGSSWGLADASDIVVLGDSRSHHYRKIVDSAPKEGNS